MRIEIDVSPWPNGDEETGNWQGDIYVDSVWCASYTSPGNPQKVFYQGVNIVSENWREWFGGEAD